MREIGYGSQLAEPTIDAVVMLARLRFSEVRLLPYFLLHYLLHNIRMCILTRNTRGRLLISLIGWP